MPLFGVKVIGCPDKGDGNNGQDVRRTDGDLEIPAGHVPRETVERRNIYAAIDKRITPESLFFLLCLLRLFQIQLVFLPGGCNGECSFHGVVAQGNASFIEKSIAWTRDG